MFIILGFVLALVFVPELTGEPTAASDGASSLNQVSNLEIDESNLLAEQQSVFGQIYENVSQSVVAITVAQENSNDEGDSFFLPFSSGSGFVVDMEGHIVTNYHVVASADRIEISMFDGTIAEAETVGVDPDSDLAVIKIDVPQDRLVPVTFADSNDLRVGQTVLALGNPFQNDWTLTSGIISALNRSIGSLTPQFSIGGVIQTDAAINPGNSGGPLLNLNGEVIGVNAQINSQTRSNSGVGFAIPSNLVIRVMDELIEKGSVDYSFMGITSPQMGIGLDIQQAYNLPDNLRGVPVEDVFADTPAADAGLLPATEDAVDVITAIDGTPIANFDELIGYLGINTRPGDEVTLTVYRNGQTLELEMTLTSRPG
jgi:2-alkenal reductase